MKQHVPSRREFVTYGGLAATAAGLAGASPQPRPNTQPGLRPGEASSARRPNVLLIMTDQHRADLMTCAGRDLVPTPNIDRIAERGVRFENAYCPYPVCLASRSAMLTGLYAHTTGAINNNDRLDWRYRTMAHHFADHGYLTGLIGKMHFNDVHNHGFEYYMHINDWLMYLGPKQRHYANEIANHPLSPKFHDTMVDDGAGFPDVADLWDGPSPWVGNVERNDFATMASQLDAEDHMEAFLVRETCKFMRRYQDQPFFLVCSLMKPHTPLFAPKEWADRYPVDAEELPEVGDIASYPQHVRNRIRNFEKKDPQLRKAHRAGYHANLAYVDACIGTLVDTLDEMGLWQNTIVVYTSDHGEMDGDHGMYQKFCLFDPSVKVPLIVCHPPQIPEGEVTKALTGQIGLYPTLTDLAGLPDPTDTAVVPMDGAPDRIEAQSFADVARQPDSTGPDAVFSEFHLRAKPCQFMLRTDQYKYIHNEGRGHELYDLIADPGESINLAEDPVRADIITRLRRRLADFYDPGRNPFRPA
ncbi:MAG: sulfatase-like hydrolase/transferase [bacterium]|nr:sulfatase-like hydrolase/transferase [bacterium]